MNDQVNTPVTETVAPAAEVNVDQVADQVVEQGDAVEIPDMPYEQLKQVEAAVTKKLRAAREKERAQDVNTAKVLVAKHGLKWADVKPAAGTKAPSGAGSTVAPKYRDPETGATWSGRGRSPQWLRDKNKEDFLIEKPAAE